MANHKSAEKRIRQTTRRTAVNRTRKSRLNTLLKKVEAAIAAGKKSEAQSAFKEAQSAMMKATSKGISSAGTTSRSLSRLSARIKKMAT